MEIKEYRIPIRDLVKGYYENMETGQVTALDGRLDVRPEYQREFVYGEKQRNAVINTILNNFPLNTLYFVKRPDGNLEVMDGQQRIISICQYATRHFSLPLAQKLGNIDSIYIESLPEDKLQTFMNYPLQVYICEGTEDEKMDWFQVVNIAGAVLTDQEIRNALYHGKWLTDAKSLFSRNNNAAGRNYGAYLSGIPNRQAYLETAFRWKANDEGITGKDKDLIIRTYMQNHRNEETADELWHYFQDVFAWVKRNFGKKPHKSMKGIEWGLLYNEHRYDELDPEYLQRKVKELLRDDEVTNKKGIYEYLLTGDKKHLSLRQFSESQKETAYEQQNGLCNDCGRHIEYKNAHADHIIPWSKGGKTTQENLQILCRKCNIKKSNKE